MIQEITQEKIKELSISSLPTRPTAPTASGGAGFSATDMKHAFDALTLHVIEKYNELIVAAKSCGEDSLSGAIPTGIDDAHTLSKLFEDIANGDFASYLKVGDTTLAEEISEIKNLLDIIRERLRI